MRAAGADIIDIGGESTRPGSVPTPPGIEQARILPVIRALAAAGALVSVDTRSAATMRAALDTGAAIVNDISGLAHDPEAAGVVARAGCAAVLMHMRGTPATMGTLARYDDVVANVADELAARLAAACAAGVRAERIVLDPGIGFAKTGEHNIALLRGLPVLARLGRPLLVGVSRKRFIGTLTRVDTPANRLPGSLAAALFALARGAAILRVHDVAETVQALRVWRVLEQGAV
ncbi:MAG: dihydropteroate synthase, partial [Proteobacteria bacterium]|nr:dihydropteroate synthase [Pseudomonadota bacterium]